MHIANMLFECCANFLTCDKREPHPERPRIGLPTNLQRPAFWQSAFILQNFVRSVIIKSTTDKQTKGCIERRRARMYFQYGEAETAYLSARDERMAAVIAQVGHIPLFGGGTPHRRPADLHESAGDHLEADAGRVRRGGCSCRPRSRD